MSLCAFCRLTFVCVHLVIFVVLAKCDVHCSSSQPFTFSNVTKPDTKPDEKKAIEEEEEPPKVAFTPITEEGAVYSKRYVPARRLRSFMLLVSLPFPIGDCPEEIMKLTAQFHLVPGFRMSGAVPPVPHTP